MTTRAPPRPGAPAAPAALSGSVPAPCPLRTPAVPSILFACQSVRINTALILDETRVECFVGPSARGGVPRATPCPAGRAWEGVQRRLQLPPPRLSPGLYLLLKLLPPKRRLMSG